MLKKLAVVILSVFLLESVNARDVLVFANPDEHEANVYREPNGGLNGELLLNVEDLEEGVIEFDIPEGFDLAYYRGSPAFLEFIPEGEEIEKFGWTKIITFSRVPNSAREFENFFKGFEKGMRSFDDKAKLTKVTSKSCKNMKSKMLCVSMSNPYVGRNEVTCARAMQTPKDIWMVQYAFEVPDGESSKSYIDKGVEYLSNQVNYGTCN